MAEINESLEELKVVKQAFKDNIDANDVPTSNVEFRNMPELLKQMEKKLPIQTKSVEPAKYPQSINADAGYKLDSVEVKAIPNQYIIPSGTKQITENNEYDVTMYSKVNVAVKGTGTGESKKFGELVDGSITEVNSQDLSDVTIIRDSAFANLEITSVEIPSNVIKIDDSAFVNNQISSLILNNGITTIGASAFANNPITALTIPNSVTTIGASAFGGTQITELDMSNQPNPPSVTSTTFPSTLTTIHVAYGDYDTYMSAWSDYTDKIVRGLAIPSTITVTVNNYLGELVSGASVTIIGNNLTFTGTTDSQGVFTQGDLQPATYTISVQEIDGFKTPSEQEVVVVEGSNNVVQFTYLEKPATLPFAQCSVNDISEISAEISAKNMNSSQVAETYGWNLGDTQDITLTTGEVIQMQIIGFNHDDKSDGTGKAGITLQMKDCLANTYPMDTISSNTGGYYTKIMKTSTLPAIKLTLPQEWQNIIKFVDKKSANGGSANYNEILTVSEDLFFLSEIEVYGQAINSKAGEGTVYEYWNGKNASDLIKRYDKDADGVPETNHVWWLRSPYYKYTNSFCRVNNSGNSDYVEPKYYSGVSFAFCV